MTEYGAEIAGKNKLEVKSKLIEEVCVCVS